MHLHLSCVGPGSMHMCTVCRDTSARCGQSAVYRSCRCRRLQLSTRQSGQCRYHRSPPMVSTAQQCPDSAWRPHSPYYKSFDCRLCLEVRLFPRCRVVTCSSTDTCMHMDHGGFTFRPIECRRHVQVAPRSHHVTRAAACICLDVHMSIKVVATPSSASSASINHSLDQSCTF